MSIHHHRSHYLIIALLMPALVVALTGCGSTEAPASTVVPAASAEIQAIQTAVQEHLARQSVPVAARIDIEMQAQQFARVRIMPSAPATDPTIGYLRRQDQSWAILGIGTAFEPDFYARYGIPQQLWLAHP